MLKIIVPAVVLVGAAWWWFADFEARVTLDPAIEHQEIHGWEVLTPAYWELPEPETWMPALLRAGFVDLGLSRYRLEVRSGVEGPVDEHGRMVAGEIEFSEYRRYWYRPINDDDDPNHIDRTRFHFTELDQSVEKIVLPLREMLAAEGRALAINLAYVSFSRQSEPSKVHHDPEEYAEFALATVLHLKEKYGIVPDTWQVLLEPDNGTGFTGTMLGNNIAATRRRFAANGFGAIRFVGPSTTSAANAVPYLEAMLKVPGVQEVMAEFSYHRYRGVSAEVLDAIAALGRDRKIPTAMLEKIGAWDDVLHEDLERAEVSAWMQFGLGGPDNAGKDAFFRVDRSDPEKPVVREHPKTRFMRQYFRHVRSGARRFAATSSDEHCRPLAFRNADGKLAIVLRCARAGTFEIADLPAGRYVVEYSTKDERAERLAEKTLEKGEAYRGRIPAAGVATLIQLD